jgi:hypothetical protein
MMVLISADYYCSHHQVVDAFATPLSSVSRGASLSTTLHRDRSDNGQWRLSQLSLSRITFKDEVEKMDKENTLSFFDPFNLAGSYDNLLDDSADNTNVVAVHHSHQRRGMTTTTAPPMMMSVLKSISTVSLVSILPISSAAAATTTTTKTMTKLSEGDFNPDTFRPVCGSSDSFYRLLQSTTRAIVGDESMAEFGPLIAGGLLRIRLELCVVESFFNEAVGPFIQQNGLNWILPLHETVETFLAGTIFALATTFILVGSTKIIQIIAFYGDLVVGGPCRLVGGFFFDRACGLPVTLDVSFFGLWKTRLVGPPIIDSSKKILGSSGGGGRDEMSTTKLVDYFDNVKPSEIPLLLLSGTVKVVGETSKIFREFIEGLDLFVGRYLVLIASGYIILKFVHFKVFPDFP